MRLPPLEAGSWAGPRPLPDALAFWAAPPPGKLPQGSPTPRRCGTGPHRRHREAEYRETFARSLTPERKSGRLLARGGVIFDLDDDDQARRDIAAVAVIGRVHPPHGQGWDRPTDEVPESDTPELGAHQGR